MINKMQKDYLEKRLNEVVSKKMDEKFKGREEKRIGYEDIYRLIEKRKLKMIPLSEGSVKAASYYRGYTELAYYFDLSVIQDEISDYNKKLSEEKSKFESKLRAIATKIMDKVMFEGLSLDAGLKEIEEFDGQ